MRQLREGEEMCQCYRHTFASLVKGTPGKKCYRLARWLIQTPIGDTYACDECKEELTKYHGYGTATKL